LLRNVYCGVALGRSINNCGLESQNKEVKKVVGSSASMTVLFRGLGEYLNHVSSRRDPSYQNTIPWQSKPTVNDALWIAANYIKCQAQLPIEESCWRIFTAGNGYLLIERESDESFFSGSDVYRNQVVRDILEMYENMSWGSIDKMYDFMNNYHLVIPLPGSDELYCHCEENTREFVCEHTLGAHLHAKTKTLPNSAARFKTKQKKRKPGRPGHKGRYYKEEVISGEEDDEDDNAMEEEAETGTSHLYLHGF
jgi:hypothetical protein